MRSVSPNNISPSAALVAGMTIWLCGCVSPASRMVVNTPLVDLRAQPHTMAQPVTHDSLEETQLLYGEEVRVLRQANEWAYVEAVEQREFTHAKHWQGYPGWLPTSALIRWDALLAPTIVVTDKWVLAYQDPYTLVPSTWRFALGTHLKGTEIGEHLWKIELLDGTVVWLPYRAARTLEDVAKLSVAEKRQAIVQSAALFIGDRYYWGGRSPSTAATTHITGVDCSGLVNLAYRRVGLDLPRDAHEQRLRAHPIQQLQPADLIFLSARNNPKQIVHVLLYAGNGEVIEGPGTGLAVHRIAVIKRFGQPIERLAPGAVVDGQTVSFGAYLP